MREVLRDAFFQIRLTEMTLDEFANGPALEDYLTPQVLRSGIHSTFLNLVRFQEKTDIFLWFCAASKPSLPFITQPRRGLPIQTCHRYQGCAYRYTRLQITEVNLDGLGPINGVIEGATTAYSSAPTGGYSSPATASTAAARERLSTRYA